MRFINKIYLSNGVGKVFYLSVFKDKFDLRSMKGKIKFILWVIIIDVFDYIEGFFLILQQFKPLPEIEKRLKIY